MSLAITLKRARKVAGEAHAAAGDRYGEDRSLKST